MNLSLAEDRNVLIGLNRGTGVSCSFAEDGSVLIGLNRTEKQEFNILSFKSTLTMHFHIFGAFIFRNMVFASLCVFMFCELSYLEI